MFDLPATSLAEYRRVLCVQPHPDDTDIALGATVARLAEGGARVTYLSVTDDAAGLSGDQGRLPYEQRVKIRREEQRRAAALLGVAEVLELGFPDAGDWSAYEARNRIVGVIRRVQPDILLTVDPWMRYEAHGDHRKTGFAAAEAALLHGFVAVGTNARKSGIDPDPAYTLPAVGFFFTENPNTFLDAGRWMNAKHLALAEHSSQWDEREYRQLLEYDTQRGAYYGRRLDTEYAEALLVVETGQLHIFPELLGMAADSQIDHTNWKQEE